MPGTMRKLGLYLGLVEDDESRYDDRYDAEAYDDAYDEPERRYAPQAAAVGRRSFDDPRAETRGATALRPQAEVAPRVQAVPAYEDAYRITTLHPHSYNDAKAIGEHYRAGTPVIMNLSEMEDSDAKRLVDFAAGLTFGLHGRIERVTSKVFLLSPEHVEVTAEDRQRIVEGGFFNQS